MMKAYTLSGAMGGESILLVKGQAAILIDSGFDFCADQLAAKIKETLGDITLNEIILTHSHYDHLGGCVGIRRLYPQTKIIANPLVSQILAKESARATMRELNKKAAEAAGQPAIDRIDELAIDVDLAPDETMQTAIGPITAIATPGHTRCSTSYYLPDDQALILSETTGVIVDRHFVPCFIISYATTVESFDRCAKLHAKRIIIPHYGMIEGQAAEEYLGKARAASSRAAEFILQQYHEGKNEEQILNEYANRYYYGVCDGAQPKMAFLINTSTMISRVISEATTADAR